MRFDPLILLSLALFTPGCPHSSPVLNKDAESSSKKSVRAIPIDAIFLAGPGGFRDEKIFAAGEDATCYFNLHLPQGVQGPLTATLSLIHPNGLLIFHSKKLPLNHPKAQGKNAVRLHAAA